MTGSLDVWIGRGLLVSSWRRGHFQPTTLFFSSLRISCFVCQWCGLCIGVGGGVAVPLELVRELVVARCVWWRVGSFGDPVFSQSVISLGRWG